MNLLLEDIKNRSINALSKSISIVENESPGYQDLLKLLNTPGNIPIIGITGPPGVGKSSLLNQVITFLSKNDTQIAVIAVDPSSPFNYGALLGDRIRLKEHYNNPNIFIRSIASRGSLGGLSEKIIEILEVVKTFSFNYIFIETVGVGQTEVEIAAIADTTLVVFAPESGDSIQTLKAGLTEIADIFVVNKADRKGADTFVKNLQQIQLTGNNKYRNIPIIKTVATDNTGIEELMESITAHIKTSGTDNRKITLLVEKVYRLIQDEKMKNIDKMHLHNTISKEMNNKDFNLYRFAKEYGSADK